MEEETNLVSDAFKAFLTEAPEQAAAWGSLVQKLSTASALDKKTAELAYISVLAALNRLNGIPFHVASARQAGATREEIISAILIGLPATGHVVTEALPVAIRAFEAP
jgi:alkylhydroperoxidase/carboxymuconolactone decarboxylase family protein YurZ